MKKVNIFWFRRDLRLDDNIGLYNSLNSGLPVLPLFIFDKNILDKLDNKNDQRVSFIHAALSEMKEKLKKINSDILIIHSTPEKAFEKITKDFEINKVFTNEDYEPYATKRDEKIKKMLEKDSIEFESFKDQCIFAKDDVLKNDGNPYSVYTPYKNKWLSQLEPKHIMSIDCKKYHKNFLKDCEFEIPTFKSLGFDDCSQTKLSKSIQKNKVEKYDQNRDLPYIDGTTKISVHLRFGTISPRKCVQIAKELNDVWLSELIWREFYMQIIYHYPKVEKSCFRDKYNAMKWENDKKQFKKWCEGKTGYPIVDAGMRELNETGFMHNRVRMITASFLIKHLLIDWRWGEKYFAEKLLDYDLSANNGNWQWVAGTGCDAAPYFRIFNPYTQQKKFDPDKEYIKKWIPEYETDDYTEEIIEHKFAYNRALDRYKEC